MRVLGKHIIAELYGCRSNILDDPIQLEKALIEAASKAKAKICGKLFYKFNPQGVTGFVLISESHMSIHTWPEYNYCAIDIFTCGESTNPWLAYDYLVSLLNPINISVMEIGRGLKSQLKNLTLKSSLNSVS